MVYCTECGEQNEEGLRFCKKCGAPLDGRMVRRRYGYERDMCFGVPMAGYTWGLLFGIVIILWGVSQLFGLGFNFWPIFAVAFGLIILWGALQRSSHT